MLLYPAYATTASKFSNVRHFIFVFYLYFVAVNLGIDFFIQRATIYLNKITFVCFLSLYKGASYEEFYQ